VAGFHQTVHGVEHGWAVGRGQAVDDVVAQADVRHAE